MSNRTQTLARQRGFTLAEILVTTAIFAIIMIAALTVYDRSNRVFKNATEAADLQQSTRIAFDKVVSDLRMAGFDYSRGGIPTGSGQYAQPDEQVEYAGPTAVVFRANFDYNSDVANGNGLEPTYSANNAGGGPIFPYVTTANDEIVAYALRSTGPNATAANVESISFYVDSSVPRRGYPNVAGVTSGGQAETLITLGPTTCGSCGIDTTNANPPYTLYRITLDDILNGRTGTPVAENIRSLQFRYYTDGVGATLLTNSDGTAIATGRNADSSTFTAANTGAIGGHGRYDPANIGTTTSYEDRQQRALIQSIRVDLVGMNASPEANYQNPTETNTSFKTYRQFALSSLIVPRNLGKQGFPEPSFNPPGPPEITGACVGHCAAPYITWNPPTAGGPVISYEVQWDTDPNGAFTNAMPITDNTARSTVVNDNGVIDPSTIVYYRIVAVNDNGVSVPSAVYPITPQNKTKPNPPAAPSSGNFGSTTEPDQITLRFTAPSTNATTAMSCAGSATVTTAANIPSQELIKFQIYRSTDSSFNPDNGQGTMVLDFDTPSQPSGTTPGGPVTWIDKERASASDPIQSLAAPASCVQYYYRVRAMDRCSRNNAMNVSNTTADSISDWFPAINQAALGGMATSTRVPANPTGLVIDNTISACPFSGNNCKIALSWNKVTTDSGGVGLAVDTYTIKRERRIQGTVAYLADATFNVSGFASTPGTTATYNDTGAIYQDLVSGLGVYEYRYSVAADVCGTPSAGFSNTAEYPGCALNLSVASSAATGAGTSGAPWVMGYGDTLAVSTASGTLASVSFQIMAGGVNIGSATTIANPGPYVLDWSNLTDNVVYQVWITVIDNTGCQMTLVRYVQQEAAAACSFQDLSTAGRPGAPPTPSLSNTGPQPRSVTFNFAYSNAANNNFAITNNQGSDAMKLNVAAAGSLPAFRGSFDLTWADVNGLHRELTLASVDWYRVSSTNTTLQGPLNVTVNQALTFTVSPNAITAAQTTLDVTSTAGFGATGATGVLYVDSEAMTYTVANATTLNVVRGARGTTAAAHVANSDVEKEMSTTVQVPTTFSDVAVNESIRLVLNFTYDSSRKNAQLTTSGSVLRKLCLKYKVISDLSRIQSCNLFGKAASSANPASCD